MRQGLGAGTLVSGSGSPIAVGNAPFSIATGDFNGDGKPDLVTTNVTDLTLTILLGTGTGGFTPAPGNPLSIPSGPIVAVVGDFNGDGKQDLAVALPTGIGVYLGDGLGGFTPGQVSPYASPAVPQSMTIGDFNGDGIADLAIPNSGGNTVTVLRGTGQGSFVEVAGSPFAAGTGINYVAVGDFNGDGKQDLATANASTNDVSLLFGDGLGGFTLAGSTIAVGSHPSSLAVGDFNGDGKVDLAVSNFQDNTVTLLFGNGTGGFTASTQGAVPAGFGPFSILAGDFNGDGLPDLVTANSALGTVSLLLNTGAGVFTPAANSFPTGAIPFSMVVADFNGDGREDIATANFSSNDVSVLVSLLDPTNAVLSTTSPLTIAPGVSVPLTLTVGQSFNGFTSLAGTVTFKDGSNVLGPAAQNTSPFTFSASGLSVGSHTFTATYSGSGGTAPSTSNAITIQVTASQTISFPPLSDVVIGVAPFTISATATSNLVVTFNSNTPSVCTVGIATVTVLTTGNCSITAQQAGDSTYAPAPPATQSFNVNNPSSQSITFYTIPNQLLGVSPFTVVAKADSGLPVGFASTTPTVCRNAGNLVTILTTGTCSVRTTQPGNGTYAAATPVVNSFNTTFSQPAGTLSSFPGSPFSAGVNPAGIVYADFNNDGTKDLAVVNAGDDTVSILLGNGLGGFTTTTKNVGHLPHAIVAGDFNGDGNADLVTANIGATGLTLLLGDGSGGFTVSTISTAALLQPNALVVMDFNGDGKQDLVVTNISSGKITLLQGDGAGGFTLPAVSQITVQTNPDAIVTGDFNGDGFQDLAVANSGDNDVTVLLGDGAGGFSNAPGSAVGTGNSPSGLAVGEFNGDGKSDIAVTNKGDGTVTVLLGNGDGSFFRPSSNPFNVGTNPVSIVAGDFNGDGITDLATGNSGAGTISVLLGIGDGSFGTPPGPPFGAVQAFGLAAADFNNDGVVDLAAASVSGVAVLLGSPAPTLSTLATSSPLTVSVGATVPLTLTVADSVTAFSTPTGAVTIYDGPTALGSPVQTSSPYTFTTAGLAAGSHQLRAV